MVPAQEWLSDEELITFGDDISLSDSELLQPTMQDQTVPEQDIFLSDVDMDIGDDATNNSEVDWNTIVWENDFGVSEDDEPHVGPAITQIADLSLLSEDEVLLDHPETDLEDEVIAQGMSLLLIPIYFSNIVIFI